MIKLENTEVVGWEAAIRGMRNPMNSWEKSDSGFGCNVYGNPIHCCNCDVINKGSCMDNRTFSIGPNDHALMTKLANAGTDHRKYLRMIAVYVDITAPLYWWKEFDTYKVGTAANSCSTMHKIHDKEFTREDFSFEHLDDFVTCHVVETGDSYIDFDESSIDILDNIIESLNTWRSRYLVACKTEEETGLSAKDIWWQMIQLLPSSYNQKRTVMLNYEVLANIYKSRNNHKLDEWRVGFMEWIKNLPYSELITRNNTCGKKDMVEVIRCKNCKHYMSKENMMNDEVYKNYEGLNLDGLCMNTDAFVNENEFCSCGQRVSKEEQDMKKEAVIYRISGYLVDMTNSFKDENSVEKLITDIDELYLSKKFQQLHIEKSKVFENDNFENPEFQDNCDIALLERHFDYGSPIETDREVIVGRKYKHFKLGKIVTVVGVGRHTENEQPLVAYTYEGKMWFRPLDMFVSEVDHEKYPDATQKYRFELVEERPCSHCDGKGYLEWKVVLNNEVTKTGRSKCKWCEGKGTGQFNIQNHGDSYICECLKSQRVTCKEILRFIKARKDQQ